MATLKDAISNIGKLAQKVGGAPAATSGAGLGKSAGSPSATASNNGGSGSRIAELARQQTSRSNIGGTEATQEVDAIDLKDTGVETGAENNVSNLDKYNSYAKGIISGDNKTTAMANAAADSAIGTPGSPLTDAQGNAKETQLYDPNYSGDFMQAYKTYGGNKGADLYDFMTTGSQEDWQSFVTDPSVKRFYADDYAKFGDLSDDAAMNQFYNQFTADDFISAYDNDSAGSAQLYRDIVGDDASATTALNTSLYNNGLITPYSDSQTGIVTFDDKDAIAALDYSVLMQQLGAAGNNPDAIRNAYSDYEAKYLGRYGGNYLNTGEGSPLMSLSQNNAGFTGGYGYLNDNNIKSLEQTLGEIYGFNSSIPTETEFANTQTNGGLYKNPKFTDYLSSRLTATTDTGVDTGETAAASTAATKDTAQAAKEAQALIGK